MDDAEVSEYADPVMYDAETARRESDAPFYVDLGTRVGGPVLDLGCGTGRITIPLAEAGFDVTGLDLSPEMLHRGRAKAPGVTWVESDVRAFHLGRRFRLIMDTGPAFQHLLERSDHEAMLARVREHLEPDGIFVLNLFFGRPQQSAEESPEQEWFSYVDELGREVVVSGTEQYDHVRQVQTETAIRRWRAGDGTTMVRRSPLRMRYVSPPELEALVHYNGFTVAARCGGPDRSPLTSKSEAIIYLCRLA